MLFPDVLGLQTFLILLRNQGFNGKDGLMFKWSCISNIGNCKTSRSSTSFNPPSEEEWRNLWQRAVVKTKMVVYIE